jgi:hypothetical protein
VANFSGDAEGLAGVFAEQVVPALGDPSLPTPAGKAFADAIMRMTGGPRPFFEEGYANAFTINFGVLQGAVAASGAANAAADNTTIEYALSDGLIVSAAQLNREITRVHAGPGARDRTLHPEFAPVTGRIARPFMTLHNTGDLFVPISIEQAFRRAVGAAGRGDLLVQRAVRRAGHCAFSQDELTRAFDDLVTWVRTGVRPAGDDLLGDLTDAGIAFTSPLEPGDAVAREGPVGTAP